MDIQFKKDLFWCTLSVMIKRHFKIGESYLIDVDRNYSNAKLLKYADRYRFNDYFSIIRTARELCDLGEKDWLLRTYTEFIGGIKVCLEDYDITKNDVKLLKYIFVYPTIKENRYETITFIVDREHRGIFSTFSTYKILVMGNVFLPDIRSVIGKVMLDVF